MSDHIRGKNPFVVAMLKGMFPDVPVVENYFGGCPHCGRTSGFLNVGRDHWLVCEEHRTKWCIGSNLFSSWRDESEEDWRRNADLLDGYQSVVPLPCTDTRQ